jgi:phosphoribosylglycinamide formyltransferase 1
MIGVLVSGDGTNLQALLDNGLPVVAVASNRPRVRALERAADAGVPTRVFSLERFPDRETRDAAMAAWLTSRDADVVVCAGYMHLLTAPFLARFAGRILNVHPSLLPDFPGARAIADALTAGVATTGVTVHLVEAGLDTGPVVAQEPVAVEPRETLERRIHAAEHRLLPAAAREMLARVTA